MAEEKKPEAAPAAAAAAATPEKKPEAAPAPDAKAEGEHGGEEAAAPAPKGGGKMVYITVGSCMLLMPILGLCIALFVVNPKIKAETKKAEAGASEGEHGGEHGEKKDDGHGEKKDEHGGGGGHGGKEDKEAKSFEMPDMVVNIAGTQGSRFMRTSIEIMGSSSALAEMKERKSEVYQIVSQILSSKKLAELDTPDVRSQLRSDIMALLNSNLKKGEVTNVFIPELVIQ